MLDQRPRGAGGGRRSAGTRPCARAWSARPAGAPRRRRPARTGTPRGRRGAPRERPARGARGTRRTAAGRSGRPRACCARGRARARGRRGSRGSARSIPPARCARCAVLRAVLIARQLRVRARRAPWRCNQAFSRRASHSRPISVFASRHSRDRVVQLAQRPAARSRCARSPRCRRCARTARWRANRCTRSSVKPALGVVAEDRLPAARRRGPISSASSRWAACSGGSPSTSRRPAGISSSAGSPTASRGWRTSHTCSLVVGERSPTAPRWRTISRVDLFAVGVAEALDAHVHEPPAGRRSRRRAPRRPPLMPSPPAPLSALPARFARGLRDELARARCRRRAPRRRTAGPRSSPRPIVSPAGRWRRRPAGRRLARRQSWRVMRAGPLDVERQRAGRLGADRAAEHRAEAGAQVGADGRAHAGGQRDRDRLEQQVEHGERVVGDAAVARALDRRRTCARPAASGSRARAPRARSRAPPCRRARAASSSRRFPGPGPQTAASQPSVRSPWCSAPAVRDRLALAAEGRARRQVAGEQAALAQRAHGARVPAGQRAALGLHVAEPRARARPARTPTRRAASWPCRASTATGRSQRQLAAARPRPASTACCRLV